MPRIEPFEQYPERYDRWFDEHPEAFDAEVQALRALVPRAGRGLEVGVGTGRFAQALGIADGVDPSPEMRRRARARGIRVQDGKAEQLPYEDAAFDYAVLVTTVCFIDDLDRTLAEAYRVLKPTGALVIGMVDRESPLGQRYRQQQDVNPFYRPAHFWTTDEVVRAMRQAGFEGFAFRQTLFGGLNGMEDPGPVTTGYGEGAFVVLRGRKPTRANEPPDTPHRPNEQPGSREIRHSRITGRDVIIAPMRGGRPQQEEADIEGTLAATHPDCPFCPGHEERLPYVIDERAATNGQPWQTRAVPNKYPALVPSSPLPRPSDGLFPRMAADGRQEVIIESPIHGQDLADLSVSAMETVIATYQARCRAVRAGEGDLIPFLFRNYGTQAGASLAHPHSQLIATAQRPKQVRAEEHRAAAYFEDTGRCLYCDVVRRETDGPRGVARSEAFLALVPFAAEVSCEMMVLPSVHHARFTAMGAEMRRDLAGLLRRVLRSLRTTCGDPHYNFYLRMPLDAEADSPHLHWYLRLLPRTKVQAGFEVGTGLRINPSSPEEDAAHLRRAVA
ncbi:MAG: methyltransferase domain-containing protein [Bacteroidetes bacterium]|jgi:UDPglucose--hexose-1-phosphate uridylyltransferase|nr:methyltransferase domain-containing protein [Bacteroidota bacterium]